MAAMYSLLVFAIPLCRVNANDVSAGVGIPVEDH